jgi:glutathionyl-hydroquinone reductase
VKKREEIKFEEGFGEEKREMKVFTDMDYVNNYLQDERFCLVDNIAEADILWMNVDIFKELAKQYKPL